MRGGLRWPYRPFQVTCVLVAVLLTAAFSLSSAFTENLARQPIPDKPNLGSSGAPDVSTGAFISGNPNATAERRGMPEFSDWQERDRQ
jgi:hypothetical protein